jgi:hypothetical protein
MLYRVHLVWAIFELTMLLVIGTDCIGSWKSNYHTITTTTARRQEKIIIKPKTSILFVTKLPDCKRIVGLSRHRTIATVSYFYELVLWFWIRNGYPWSNKFALFVRKRFLEVNFRNRNNNFNIKGLPGNHKTFTGKRTYEGAADPECLNRPGFKGILYTHVVIYRTIGNSRKGNRNILIIVHWIAESCTHW